ncbi:Acetyltransferase, gnat family [Sulfitobacter noctilucicola]|uniref:L-amino acid N-acyltransferase YncA n=1 Tax=Sulfitobacter noctilucicola TaxID=1342301 RepID=A0A7W6M550_9RHOB|nr:GNAT family N-acetyltransferase [Sulfitobacter noctilucicola]KIN62851.1 Acetyltransferase, gnat family [Sulfitobacter noctilucicola]MBB4172618.1 L-amino acid N-acyltransferase YncA [Sulfitobacter noctilucicola]
MIKVRSPITLDYPHMAHLLNAIIEAGGTTALTRSVKGDDLAEWMEFAPERSAWHVAVDAQEKIVGFQWIEPESSLPPEAANIATFVQIGQTGLGIGSALFEATRRAAKSLGYVWINANIRADNEGGLIYYQSRGFQDYGRVENYRMGDGQIVDKILKRYDL